MKRIVFVINSLALGGAQRLLVDDANEFFRRGHEVFVVTLEPDRGASLAPALLIPEDHQRHIYFKSSRDFGAFRALFQFFKAQKPDLVITHLWLANNVARSAAYCAGVPTIFAFEHSVYDGVKSRKQFLLDRFFHYFGTKVIAVSDAVKDSLVRNGIRLSCIEVLPNAIDIHAYENPQCDSGSALSIPDTFTFTFIGRLIPAKAVDLLLSAFALVNEGMLLIVGDGPERARLEAQAQELGIAERVTFLGARSDVPCILEQSHCLVLPSRREGFGIVLLEALASGVPVVATGFEAAKEIIQDQKTGLLVPQENKEMLARAMEKIMKDEILRKSLIEEGKKRVQNFSVEAHADALLSFAQKSRKS